MDKRKKKVLMILGLGSIVLAWRMYVLFFEYLPDYRKRTPSAVSAAAPPTVNPMPSIDIAIEVPPEESQQDPLTAILEEQAVVAQRPWKDSPFVMPLVKLTDDNSGQVTDEIPDDAPESPPLNFVGVSRTGTRWLAAVDGRIVRVGDKLAQTFEVTEIGKDWITIEAAGWQHKFHLGSDSAVVMRATERSQ